MNIVYFCFGSAHSSIVSAHIHLGDLPSERIPTEQEILAVGDFDSNITYFLGTLFYKGTDELGRRVFTMGMGPEMDIVREAFLSMIELSGGKREDYVFFMALPHINRLAKFGGALSRRYGLTHWGRKLAIKGIQQSYPRLIEFVKNCKNALGE
ncbi:MAG TPA: DUF3189 family protein [Bacillota bacterium]|nr:DUF3189 family protein [Bacillota bacterium]